MGKTISNKTYRLHVIIKAFGITALVFFILVSAVGAAPFADILNVNNF